MADIRWFGPNRYTQLVIANLRERGLDIATEGDTPARLAFAASGTVAREAWRYCRRHNARLVLYIWDLPTWRLGNGRSDVVFELGSALVRLPRLSGAYPERREYYSALHHIARQAAEVWVPSRATETDVRSRFGTECRYVPYCFDDALFTPGDAKRDSGTLLSVSRLFPHKNQELAIAAAVKLRMPLRIIGRGPREAHLRALADRASVKCTVETQVTDEALLTAYRESSAVICPSRFEGFGLTGIEAASCGTRVAASDIPPHREFMAPVAQLFPLSSGEAEADAAAKAVQVALGSPAPDPAAVQWLSVSAAASRFADGFSRLLT